MNIHVEPFWIEKRGNSPQEYDDARWPTECKEFEENRVRIAVADGATESLFAGRWAQQLVDAVGDGCLSLQGFSEGVSRLRARWREWLAGRTFPWYAEEKARQGTFAALVAMEVNIEDVLEASEPSWCAVAVGDSCLFHIRGDEVLNRFPITNVSDFDNRPILLGSIGEHNDQISQVSLRHGTCKTGDAFYLMTDALACWFLKHLDAGGSPKDVQGNFGFTHEPEPFRAWVESLRKSASIRNDDCTLIRAQVR